MMRRLLLLSCAAMAAPAFGDEAPTARRQAEARRLLDAHGLTVADDIGGFNRRNALCPRAAAAAAAAYDATHAASFTRTLGWRWDPNRLRWVPAAPADAEVKLVYKGVLYSGAVTAEGVGEFVCGAEVPSELEGWARFPMDGNERSWIGDSVTLAKLPSVVSARPTDALGASASTPRAEREARAAKAQALLDEEARRLEARAAAGNEPSDCQGAKMRAAGDRRFITTTSLLHDGARDTWTDAKTAPPDVEVEIRTPWDGKAILAQQCFAFRPVTLVSRANWQSEGDVVVIFRIDLPRKPEAMHSAPRQRDGHGERERDGGGH